MRRNVRFAGLAALVLSLAGCEVWYNKVPSPDELWYVIPWFDHMIDQPSVHPYETAGVPRNTVPGTVPITGAEANWEAEFRSGNATTADQLVNPLGGAGGAGGAYDGTMRQDPSVPQIPATIAARGDTLYQTFCAVCHGAAGDGNGPVGPRVAAPSIITAQAAGYSDGYLYSIIRYGRGSMPRYGDKVFQVDDRWAIVNYVRRLQAGAPAAGGAN